MDLQLLELQAVSHLASSQPLIGVLAVVLDVEFLLFAQLHSDQRASEGGVGILAADDDRVVRLVDGGRAAFLGLVLVAGGQEAALQVDGGVVALFSRASFDGRGARRSGREAFPVRWPRRHPRLR